VGWAFSVWLFFHFKTSAYLFICDIMRRSFQPVFWYSHFWHWSEDFQTILLWNWFNFVYLLVLVLYDGAGGRKTATKRLDSSSSSVNFFFFFATTLTSTTILGILIKNYLAMG
jgi:hypothetical protein